MRKKILATSIILSAFAFSENIIFNDSTAVIASDYQDNIIENGMKISNKIIFEDDQGENVSSGIFQGEEGKIYDISEIENYVYLDRNYKISPNQDKKIKLRHDGAIIRIKVVDNRIINKLIFKTDDNVKVGEKEIKGNTGEKYYIDGLPKYYDLSDDQSDIVLIGTAGHEIVVKVKYTAVNATLNFKDKNGKFIVGTPIKGELNEDLDFTDYLPKGYKFLNGFESYGRITKINDVFECTIIRTNIKHTVKFIDENNKQVGLHVVEGDDGDWIDIEKYIPKNYYYNGSSSVLIKDDNSDIIFNVSSEDTNYDDYQTFFYVDVNGKEIWQSTAGIKKGKSTKVKPLDGYKIIGNDTVSFVEGNDSSKYPKIVLEGLPQTNKIILKDSVTNKIVKIISLTGKNGEKIDLNKISVKGYKILTEYYDDLVFSKDEKEKIVFINKITMTEVHFVMADGTIVGKQEMTTPEGRRIYFKIPKGFVVADNIFNQLTADSKRPIQTVLVVPVDPTKISTQINFIDRKNNKTIYSYAVQGKQGQKINIKVPNGYELDKGISDNLTLDKAKTSVNIYVVEKNSTNESSKYSSVVLTKQSVTTLFDKNGNKLNNRALGSNSSWRVNQKLTHNGVTYYRVATNEYVKATDVLEYENVNSTVNTKTGSAKYLYDINGKRSEKRALAGNTAWFSDRSAIVNGEKMYRVATNEWVKASDII